MPMTSGTRVTEKDPDASKDLLSYYSALIGSLLYFCSWSRQDISFAVGYLSLFMGAPTNAIVRLAHRVFAYLKLTAHYCLRMRGGISPDSQDNNMLRAYSDSSDGDDAFTSRSTGGYLLYLNGSLVSWQSKLQKLITLSSCES
eukprot:3918460-Rhodomonas_salina.2